MRKVFLAHASEDNAEVAPIHLALVNAGLSVFYDEQSLPAGADYEQRIFQAIQECDVFVFVATTASIAPGKFTLTELRFAQERWPSPVNRVLPVMLGGLGPRDLPAYLAAVTAFVARGNAAAEARVAVLKLLSHHRRKALRGVAWMLAGATVLTVLALRFALPAVQLWSDTRLVQELENLSKKVIHAQISLYRTPMTPESDVAALFGSASLADQPRVAVRTLPTPFGSSTFTLEPDPVRPLAVSGWSPVGASGSLKIDRRLPPDEAVVAIRMDEAAGDMPARLFERLATGKVRPVTVRLRCLRNEPTCRQALQSHWVSAFATGGITFPIDGSRKAIAVELEAEAVPSASGDSLVVQYRVRGNPYLYNYVH